MGPKLSRLDNTVSTVYDKFVSFFLPGHAGPVFQSAELRRSKLCSQIQFPHGPLLPLPSWIYSRSRQTFFESDHRLRTCPGC